MSTPLEPDPIEQAKGFARGTFSYNNTLRAGAWTSINSLTATNSVQTLNDPTAGNRPQHLIRRDQADPTGIKQF